jgi:hypothetical protein
MKKYIYVLKLKFILKTLSIAILSIVVILIIFILDKSGVQKINVHAIGIVGLIYIIPSLVLLIEYLFFSLNKRIQIEGTTIVILENNLIINYQYSDILFVTKFCSYPYSQNRTRCYLATDCYYFLKIKMKDNKEFLVTSLMTDMSNNQFIINKIEPKFIPSIVFSP